MEVIILTDWHLLGDSDPQKDPYTHTCRFGGNVYNDQKTYFGTYITTDFFKEFVDATTVRCKDGKVYKLDSVSKHWEMNYPYPNPGGVFLKHYENHLHEKRYKTYVEVMTGKRPHQKVSPIKKRIKKDKKEIIQFSIQLSKDDIAKLEELQQNTSISSISEICKRNSRFVHYLWLQISDGWELKLERTVGDKTEVQTIPSVLIF